MDTENEIRYMETHRGYEATVKIVIEAKIPVYVSNDRLEEDEDTISEAISGMDDEDIFSSMTIIGKDIELLRASEI